MGFIESFKAKQKQEKNIEQQTGSKKYAEIISRSPGFIAIWNPTEESSKRTLELLCKELLSWLHHEAIRHGTHSLWHGEIIDDLKGRPATVIIYFTDKFDDDYEFDTSDEFNYAITQTNDDYENNFGENIYYRNWDVYKWSDILEKYPEAIIFES